MVQVLQRPTTWQEALGSGLGSGLSSGLEQLARMRLGQMQQRQQAQAISQAYKSLGLPEELAYLPKEAQRAVFSGLLERGGLGELSQQLTEQPMQQSPLSQLGAQLQPMQAPMEVQQRTQDRFQGMSPTSLMETINLGTILGGTPDQSQQATAGTELARQGAQRQELIQPEQKQQLPQKQKTFADVLAQPTKKELTEQRRDEFQRQKLLTQQQAQADKETKQFYADTVKEAEGAKKSDLRLDRMEKLVKRGDLPSAHWYRFFKGLSEVGGSETNVPILGPLIGLLANPIGGLGLAVQRARTSDVEEFEKLSADFVRDVKNFFPGRITNTELNAFLATIPTLSQTDQGKISIIENMRNFNKAAELKNKTMKEIIKDHGGRRPIDLPELVEERIRPQLDKLAEEFKVRITKPIEYDPRDRWFFGLLPKIPSATGF